MYKCTSNRGDRKKRHGLPIPGYIDMACLSSGTSTMKSLVLVGGWQAACRVGFYKESGTLVWAWQLIQYTESKGPPPPPPWPVHCPRTEPWMCACLLLQVRSGPPAARAQKPAAPAAAGNSRKVTSGDDGKVSSICSLSKSEAEATMELILHTCMCMACMWQQIHRI
jgi:hypothetical protein